VNVANRKEQPGKSLVYFFSPDEVDRKNWVGAIRPLARRYAEYLTFVTVDSSEYPEIVTGLGVPGGAAATGLSLSNPGMGKVFPFPDTGELNLEAVEQFIVGISEGKIDAWDGQWRESTEGGEAKGHDEL
jgi:protein disulfide-isomerase A1